MRRQADTHRRAGEESGDLGKGTKASPSLLPDRIHRRCTHSRARRYHTLRAPLHADPWRQRARVRARKSSHLLRKRIPREYQGNGGEDEGTHSSPGAKLQYKASDGDQRRNRTGGVAERSFRSLQVEQQATSTNRS
ncbi:MAG: hypothetical protein JWN37_608 [Candidatus Nomurabacteria bacterium]|nr:hypothetical protein [Candidatus Nomurabacteria bacterium]